MVEGRLGSGVELLVGVEWLEGQWVEEEGLVRIEGGEDGSGRECGFGVEGDGAGEGVWTNGFAVRGEEADGEQGNNVVEWVTEVRRETDLAVGLELGQEEGLVGRELGYEVVVTNLGPHEARGVVLEMEWLGEVELVLVEASQGDWEETGGKVRCEIGEYWV